MSYGKIALLLSAVNASSAYIHWTIVALVPKESAVSTWGSTIAITNLVVAGLCIFPGLMIADMATMGDKEK